MLAEFNFLMLQGRIAKSVEDANLKLLTPPGTPLFPSLEMESRKTVMSQLGTSRAHPTALTSRWLVSQELASSEDEGGSSFIGGQDAANKAKMVRAFEEEEHKCPSEEVREVDSDRRAWRSRIRVDVKKFSPRGYLKKQLASRQLASSPGSNTSSSSLRRPSSSGYKAESLGAAYKRQDKRSNSVPDSPLATSSNASSEVSVSNNVVWVDGSEIDEDISSDKGARSPASVRGR
ncbi:hypothetical protein KY285_016608 [Solanum tuberosum]|nr:hypothetical protein KY284_018598 [Solanum tuberosum]KAH0702330.1 hypothetical protein KY285_016608 [Solanum tuberosum]